MLKLIQVEFLKLRRRKFIWLMLLAALFMPLAAVFYFASVKGTGVEPIEFYKWTAFSYTPWIILPVVLGMLCTMLMYNENQYDKGGRSMYLVKILNADYRPIDVEVSLEIYRVYEESRKQEERQRYERRKHIEGRSFDNCLLFDLATEPLEETFERLETLQEIGRVLEQLPPLQRWRFILHFFYGYSYSEIAKMQDCNKSAVMRSVQSALKKVRKNIAA